MSTKDHFREPQVLITHDGEIRVGVRPTDDDDPSKELACSRTIPEWMIKRAYIAILKRELSDD